MTTVELVNKMRKESKEVKNSNGGTKIFRNVMNTITSNEIKVFGEWDGAERMKSEEIAKIVQDEHTTEEIESLKKLYETN